MKKLMKNSWERRLRRGVTLTGIAALGSVAISTACAAQTLQQSAVDAIRSNPRIEVVARNREAIEQEVARARGLYLPQIDLRVGAGPERTENASTRARGGSSDLTRRDAGIFATQRVFDGWETDSEVARQKARSESAAHRIGEAVEFVALDAVEAHIEILRQTALLRLAGDNVDRHCEIWPIARQRAGLGPADRESHPLAFERCVRVNGTQPTTRRRTPRTDAPEQPGGIIPERPGGIIPEIDADQAEARLEAAIASELETRGALDDANSRYVAVVNQQPVRLAEASLPVTRALQVTSLEGFIAAARRNNPTLRVTQTDIRVAEREVEGTESAFYPRVNLELGASRNRDVDGTRGDDSDMSALLVMRWNLYRGGADAAQRLVALGRMSQTIAQNSVAVRNTEEDIRRAWILKQTADERIPVLESATKKNVEVSKTYREQFSTNVRSLIDVLNAENEVFVSRGRLVTAQLARIVAGFRLLAFTGELVNALGIEGVPESDPARRTASPADPRRAPVR
jgi:adhesin transport system outer membrane protein